MGREPSEYQGIRAASQSSIEIRFSYKGVRCKERIQLKPTAPNLRKAFRHREAILDAIASGDFDYSDTFPNSENAKNFTAFNCGNTTIKEYFITWLQAERLRLKSSTYVLYRNIVNNILIEQFGHYRLDEITRPIVKSWVNKQTCGNKRMNNMLIPLRRILQEAYEDELIQANPLHNFKYKKNERVKPQDTIDPLTNEEIAAILESLKSQKRNIIEFALWTGLRPSEYIALDWGDIDFINGNIHITKVLTDDAKFFEIPKTDAGKRIVKILPPAMEVLKRQKALTFLKNKEVFQSFNGSRYTGAKQVYKTVWINAMKKSGVRHRKLYQTRHTYASRMISAGENIMWVSKQLGHSTWTITANTYARWLNDADPKAGNKAVDIFSEKCGTNVAQG